MARIASVENVGDGRRVLVTLAAPPVGTLHLSAARTPKAAARYLSERVTPSRLAEAGERPVLARPVGEGGLVWEALLVPGVTPEQVEGVRRGYFVSATDDAGPSDFFPVWLARSSGDHLNEAATALQDILVAHRPLLDLALARHAPRLGGVTVRQILVGMPSEAADWPVIDIAVTNWADAIDEVEPTTSLATVRGTIFAFAQHEASLSWRPAMAALGMAIRDVLNQEMYLEIELPSGLVLTHSLVETVEVAEVDDGSNFWTMATLTWGAQTGLGLA